MHPNHPNRTRNHKDVKVFLFITFPSLKAAQENPCVVKEGIFGLLSESEMIMGDMGYILGYVAIGTFLLGALVGYLISEIIRHGS